jgi:hypothetical protein
MSFKLGHYRTIHGFGLGGGFGHGVLSLVTQACSIYVRNFLL